MRGNSDLDLSRSLAPLTEAESRELFLEDGSRVAVIGGGPAGSFFSFFLLKMAATVDLDVAVDIYEPRSFRRCGPAGCNHCGGIVSESLVQILAAEGIPLPPEVVQRGIESYVVHMDVGDVEIESPAGERRIAALYRGNGPREGGESDWRSFDDYLQEMAVAKGARVIPKVVTGLERREGLPHVVDVDGGAEPYDLVCLASGVNSNFMQLLNGFTTVKKPPKTTRTYICEFRSSREEIQRVLGDSMHVFLLSIPRLEFAALIPKGEFVTMCLLGDDVDQELVNEFLNSPEVLRCFPADATPCVCSCSPLINVKGTHEPFADRLVLIGDTGVTRLYKDGIGAAFRTAKAAATTAVFQGISEKAFRDHYKPACGRITADNRIGQGIFALTTVFKLVRPTRRAILRMASLEQESRDKPRRMSAMLWNLFTGSAPYGEILKGAMHPGFVTGFLWNLALGVRPNGNGRKAV